MQKWAHIICLWVFLKITHISLTLTPMKRNNCLCDSVTRKKKRRHLCKHFFLCLSPINQVLFMSGGQKCTRFCCKGETWRTIKAPDLFIWTTLRPHKSITFLGRGHRLHRLQLRVPLSSDCHSPPRIPPRRCSYQCPPKQRFKNNL